MIDLDAVASELDWLDPEPVYIGGATVPLYLDEFGRSQMRPTEDVDCIVSQVATRKAWWDLEAELRKRHWSPDTDGPVCRYRSPAGAIVDLMPTDPSILGFSGQWYPRAVEKARPHTLASGRTVLVASPALLFACKLEAFRDRGESDPWASKDLEDIAALLDGCSELLDDMRAQDEDVRTFVAERLTSIEASRDAREALRAQLPRGGDDQRQHQRITQLIQQLVQPG